MTKTPGQTRRDDAPPQLLIASADFVAELNQRTELGRNLQTRPTSSPEEFKTVKNDYQTWDEYNRDWLRRRFNSSAIADQYKGGFEVVSTLRTFSQEKSDFRDTLEAKIRRLEPIGECVPLMATRAEKPPAAYHDATGAATVFIVHGHDDARKQEVARFLERLLPETHVTILHEQPNSGRTIIEKFEDHAAQARYAVVLFTGDDEGRSAGTEPFSLRARQNVVFELGFFFSELGRSHVAVLYEEGVEILSDINGVLYIAIDAEGAWKSKLAKELKAAAFNVDTDVLLH